MKGVKGSLDILRKPVSEAKRIYLAITLQLMTEKGLRGQNGLEMALEFNCGTAQKGDVAVAF